MIQAGAHGILPAFATRDDRPNLLKIFFANDLFDFVMSICVGNDDDSIDALGILKCAYRARDDRFPCYYCKQFVEAHAAAVTGRDEDACQHWDQKRRTSNVGHPIPNGSSVNSTLAFDVGRWAFASRQLLLHF